MILLISLFAFSTFVAAEKPKFKPFGDFLSFERAAKVNGRRHVQDFSYVHEDGTYTSLRYDVTHSEHVWALRDETNLNRVVHCSSKVLTLEYSAAETAADHPFYEGAFVTGSHEYGCKDEASGDASAILRRVKKVARSGSLVKLLTEPATYTDVFEDADIEMKTTYFPENHFTQVYHPHPDETPGVGKQLVTPEIMLPPMKQRKRGVGSFFRRAWSATKDLGKKVGKFLGGVPALTKALTTGDYFKDGEWTRTLGFNYAGSGSKTYGKTNFTIGGNIACVNCFGTFAITLTFKLDVKSYKLNELVAQISSEAEFNLGAHFDAQGTLLYSGERNVFTVRMQKILAMVGPVPVAIDLDMPVIVGADVEGHLAVATDVNLVAKGSLVVGMSYTNTDGMRFLHDQSLSKDGGIVGASGNVSLLANIYALTMLNLKLEFIGGPNAGVKPSLQAVVQGGAGQCGSAPTKYALESSLNWGLDIATGVFVDIRLGVVTVYKKYWEPLVLEGARGTLWTKCLQPGKAPVITVGGFPNGKTWNGPTSAGLSSFMWWSKSSSSCTNDDTISSGEISVQLIDGSNPQQAVWAIGRSFTSKDSQCSMQQQFVGPLPTSSKIVTLLADKNGGNDIDTSTCASGNYTSVASYFVAKLADGALSLMSGDYCLFSLVRSKQDEKAKPSSVLMSFEPNELPKWYYGSSSAGLIANKYFSPDGQQSGKMLFPLSGTNSSAMYARIGYSYWQTNKTNVDFSKARYFSFLAVKDAPMNVWASVTIRNYDTALKKQKRYMSEMVLFKKSPTDVSVFNFDMAASDWKEYVLNGNKWVPSSTKVTLAGRRDMVASFDIVASWNTPKFTGYGSVSFDDIELRNTPLQEPVYACPTAVLPIRSKPCGTGDLQRYTKVGEPMLAGSVTSCTPKNSLSVFLPESLSTVGYIPSNSQNKCNAFGEKLQ